MSELEDRLPAADESTSGKLSNTDSSSNEQLTDQNLPPLPPVVGSMSVAGLRGADATRWEGRLLTCTCGAYRDFSTDGGTLPTVRSR